MRADLREAEAGNLGSPVKAATDVLRDTREALRSAVEYGGLTPASHRYFVEEFNAVTNRISFGPPRRRNLEYAARGRDHRHRRRTGARLRADEAGARFRIEARYGERVETSQADVLIVARLDAYSPLTDASPLSDNLLGRGLVRPYLNGGYHPGGIEIDQQLHPVGADGVPEARIWIVGFPVEGPHFIRTRCRAAHRSRDRRRSVRARADRHDRRRRDEACPASAGPVCRESAGVAGRGMRPRPF